MYIYIYVIYLPLYCIPGPPAEAAEPGDEGDAPGEGRGPVKPISSSNDNDNQISIDDNK